MKLVRFAWGDEHLYGILEDDRIYALRGQIFDGFSKGDESIPVRDVRLLMPVVPSKVVAVGRNYTTYDLGNGVPTTSMKVPTACIGPDEPVPYPPLSQQVIMEAELAIVLKSAAKNVPAELALDHVLGYTVANDFTARDIMRADGRPCRAKNFDGFCPLGPVIETDLDPGDARIWGRVNGEVKQHGSTKDMIASVPEVVAMFSEIMLLVPGDVILTATPSPPPYVKPGDVTEAEVEGVGALRNPVVSAVADGSSPAG
jgi:2-keto-4-pentenoate hydratase/2-oxohepta-3-ene-1,7-dioic acid hydratase in catechol pathway